ncbi:CbtB domain-containing protein [Rhodococcus sp. HNM0569]|uniref:CbtB domain-containing protein n=1 Tax=Rhodococcus sp. HNM0569 TaxID=2716340 RepID=UPI00146ADE0F|nr:CbtB domain-containing protein [Rhodococcus sp. HNM0569]NLU82114.1 CbtB-domain containing protein [Rhodococcus sp. HNM0569]
MALVHSPDASIDAKRLAAVSFVIVLLAMLALYVVGFDQGAVSRTGMYMHELMHDGRHLLGLPCH